MTFTVTNNMSNVFKHSNKNFFWNSDANLHENLLVFSPFDWLPQYQGQPILVIFNGDNAY